MSQYEKLAWFNLAVVAATIVAVACLVPWLGLYRGSAAFGLLAFLAAGALFGWKGRDKSRVIADERDHGIFAASQLFAFRVFWGVFVLGCLALYYFYGQDGAVPARLLPLLVWPAFIVLLVTQSIAILVQYAWGRHDAQR